MFGHSSAIFVTLGLAVSRVVTAAVRIARLSFPEHSLHQIVTNLVEYVRLPSSNFLATSACGFKDLLLALRVAATLVSIAKHIQARPTLKFEAPCK